MGGYEIAMAREPKNPNAGLPQSKSITDLIQQTPAETVNTDIDTNINGNIDVNVDGNEGDKMTALKAKMAANKVKESNKQVTVYLTPENYKRFNKLKAKGEKSELINQLLDMYFSE